MQKETQMGEKDMILYCAVTARKTRKLAGIVSVVRGGHGEEWRGSKGRAVQNEYI